MDDINLAIMSPNKEKNQLWHACKNSLPTKLNLCRQIVINNTLCDRCRTALQTTLHALWECLVLDEVWSDVTLWDCQRGIVFADFNELALWILQKKKNPELFAMITWSIWNQRNQVRVQQPHCNLDQLAQLAKDRQDKFMAVQTPLKPRTAWQHVQWQPPSPDWLKINFDGALFTA